MKKAVKSFLHNPGDDRCCCGHPRKTHLRWNDLPWDQRGPGDHCLIESCNCNEFFPRIVTAKGTVIQRYRKTGVGKLVGSRLYIHKAYIQDCCVVFPICAYDNSLLILQKIQPYFKFNCLRINLKTNEVRFDEAPDFDTSREPHVGRWFNVKKNGDDLYDYQYGFSNAIWHHKFLWVKPSYARFSVQKSMEWSAKYAPLIAGIPRGTDAAWAKQLEAAGLI